MSLRWFSNSFKLSRSKCACVVALLATGTLTACSPDESVDANTLGVGLLLPYTGSSSGTSANFERSVIYGVGRVNAAGGVKGKHIRLVAADTHSSLSRSLASAKELVDKNVVVVIGPESSDIATRLEPELLERGVAFISPLVGAADDKLVNCSDQWFRLAQSARALGEALAKQLAADAVASTAVLHEAGGYNDAFRTAAEEKFASLGGQVLSSLELDPNAQSYDSVIDRVINSGAESVILATSPRTAALVINEFDAVTRTPPKWYLSPLLKTDLLVQNVAPSALDGAKGIAPAVSAKWPEFSDAFRRRWEGDTPLEGAGFYYDAVALVAYALEMSEADDSGTITAKEFKRRVIQAAQTRGIATHWDEIEVGLERIRDGSEINYTGVTGTVLLDQCGARRSGASSVWTVESGQISDVTGK
jgi:ABC-type branched-subunit amino acid transport system substrate-binding protein